MLNINDIEKNTIINGNSLEVLKSLPDNSIDCCVTSPPYYNLRDYGCDGQIGLEETPEAYIAKLSDVFMEVYRVLKPEGTLWLNIGDSYNGNKKGNTETIKHKAVAESNNFHKKLWLGAKQKDLIGVPWMLAFTLRSKGWYLRQDIIWEKGNPLPESVTDRCTKSHEYIFLMSKSQKYYFDYEAIQEEATSSGKPRVFGANNQKGTLRNDVGRVFNPRTKNCQYDGQKPNSFHLSRENGEPDKEYYVRNKRDVWSVNVKPCKEAHFATYPFELIKPCILAGCPENGIVLDPFMGSGTTAIVARSLNRNYIGVELNPEYIKIAHRRLDKHLGMFQ